MCSLKTFFLSLSLKMKRAEYRDLPPLLFCFFHMPEYVNYFPPTLPLMRHYSTVCKYHTIWGSLWPPWLSSVLHKLPIREEKTGFFGPKVVSRCVALVVGCYRGKLTQWIFMWPLLDKERMKRDLELYFHWLVSQRRDTRALLRPVFKIARKWLRKPVLFLSHHRLITHQVISVMMLHFQAAMTLCHGVMALYPCNHARICVSRPYPYVSVSSFTFS